MPGTDETRVKYRTVAMQGAILLEIHIPIASVALTTRQQADLNDVFARVTAQVTLARDELAAQLRQSGICPWCNALRGPEGHDPECHGGG